MIVLLGAGRCDVRGTSKQIEVTRRTEIPKLTVLCNAQLTDSVYQVTYRITVCRSFGICPLGGWNGRLEFLVAQTSGLIMMSVNEAGRGSWVSRLLLTLQLLFK